MHRGKSVEFRMLFGKSACFVLEFLTLQGVEPGHLRVQAHRETAGYVLSLIHICRASDRKRK